MGLNMHLHICDVCIICKYTHDVEADDDNDDYVVMALYNIE